MNNEDAKAIAHYVIEANKQLQVRGLVILDSTLEAARRIARELSPTAEDILAECFWWNNNPGCAREEGYREYGSVNYDKARDAFQRLGSAGYQVVGPNIPEEDDGSVTLNDQEAKLALWALSRVNSGVNHEDRHPYGDARRNLRHKLDNND